jgi:hypothetical protein
MKRIIAGILGVSITVICVVVGCGKGLNDYSISPGAAFAQRINITDTQFVAFNKPFPLFDQFIRTAFAETSWNFPTFTWSPQDPTVKDINPNNQADPSCPSLDYWITPGDGGVESAKLYLIPFTDTVNSVSNPKLVVGEDYHMAVFASLLGPVAGKIVQDTSGSYVSSFKAGKHCGFASTNNWQFTLTCGSGNAQITAQTTKGDVFIKGLVAGGSCTLSASGEALADSGTGTKTITTSANFSVVDPSPTTPKITQIEFDGKALPVGSKIIADLLHLSQPVHCDESAPGFTTTLTGCSDQARTEKWNYASFRVQGENLGTPYWLFNRGTRSGSGKEMYWAAQVDKSTPVGVIVNAWSTDNTLVQGKTFIYTGDDQ